MSKISIKTAAIAAVVGGVVLGATFASAALVLPTQNCSYQFTRNFKLGSTGTDVMNLQKVLNAYSQTRISETGAGSPGNESTYYGIKTKTAVIKFQELHAADILTPVGLTKGNGNVYAGTRSVLNQICTGVVSTPTTPGTTPTVPPVTSTGPVSVSLAAGQPTGMIILGQSGAKLADFTFTGNGTVTNIELQRVGASADSLLTNTYLYDGNVRITDAASVVTGGYIKFNNASGIFTVNGSRTISVRADIQPASGTTPAGAAAGNAVGVKLNSVTTLGGSAATFTNVMGNQLVTANVTTAGVNFTSAVASSTAQPAAGTTNYTVWSGSVNVSTRIVNLKAATFKFVGSAPVDSLANISLYIDGTKIGNSSTINPANNNKVTFDLGATPFALTISGHTIELRGDIVKGSNRTMTFSVENASDLMLEDTGLVGVNISPTIAGLTFAQSNATGPTITVQLGTVTVNVDPAFVTNKVTGGATSVPVGQFVLKAYGEDVKVNSLNVTFTGLPLSPLGSPASYLGNVSLFVNGGQVGSSVPFTGTTLTFGSSNLFTLAAGQSTTVTVKADMINASSTAYTSGSVAAVIGGVTSTGQGQSSYENVSIAATAVNGNTLTVSSGAGTFAKTSGFTTTTVSPNTPNVKVGSFTLQANSAESIKVNSIVVSSVVGGNNGASANALSNYSNLTVKTGSTILGTPVGSPTASTTFSFNEIVIPANGTQSFDVYADIGGAASTTAPTLTTSMHVSYRGAISNTNTTSAAGGVAISSVSATLADAALVTSSAISQFVVGGSTFGIATYKLKTATAGTQANVRELRFVTTGQDAVTSITVGGVTSPVIGSGAGATTTVSGLNIAIDSNGTDVPVTVHFSGFQGSTTGGSLTTSIASTTAGVSITLGHIEATSGSGSVVTNTAPIVSSVMSLVASKPTVTVSAGGTDTLNLGALSKLGEFTVTADANGKISLASTSISISTVGITAPELATSTLVIRDGGTALTGVNYSTYYSSTTPVLSFTTPYEISAGQSKTFGIYGTINGTAQASIVPRVNTTLTSAASFRWVDVLGGTTVTQNGTYIYNFPSNSYTSKY